MPDYKKVKGKRAGGEGILSPQGRLSLSGKGLRKERRKKTTERFLPKRLLTAYSRGKIFATEEPDPNIRWAEFIFLSTDCDNIGDTAIFRKNHSLSRETALRRASQKKCAGKREGVFFPIRTSDAAGARGKRPGIGQEPRESRFLNPEGKIRCASRIREPKEFPKRSPVPPEEWAASSRERTREGLKEKEDSC